MTASTPSRSRSTARLRLVPPPRAGRGTRRRTGVLYAAGLAIGFMLVALVSAPTGGASVPLVLAGVSGLVALACLPGARPVSGAGVTRPVRPSTPDHAETPPAEQRRAA